jgi:hypothetical protein
MTTTHRISASYLNGPWQVEVDTTDFYEASRRHASLLMFCAGNGWRIIWEELDEDGNVVG